MKLAKKKENEKTRMDANMDLSNMRRKFHQVINTLTLSMLRLILSKAQELKKSFKII